jgi:hypothetical protein
VNSEERAHNWSDTYPDLKSPDLWDWAVVKKKAGRLIRLLRKLGKQAEPRASPDRSGAKRKQDSRSPRRRGR